MPNELTLPITPSQLPSGFCPSSEQERWNTYAAYGSVVFPSTFAGVILSSTKPTDTTKAWGQLDQYGRLIRIYNFANGQWVSFHPVASGLTMWWFKTLPDLNTFDGGDANAVGDASGPMWQLAKDLAGNEIQAKFPIAKGALPSTTVLAIGDTGGEEKHTQTVAEMPAHKHAYKINTAGELRGNSTGTIVAPIATNGVNIPASGYETEPTDNVSTGGGTPFNEMPPYIVGALLQRTTRLFFAVT